jgi:hypothetical protein
MVLFYLLVVFYVLHMLQDVLLCVSILHVQKSSDLEVLLLVDFNRDCLSATEVSCSP